MEMGRINHTYPQSLHVQKLLEIGFEREVSSTHSLKSLSHTFSRPKFIYTEEDLSVCTVTEESSVSHAYPK